MQYAECWNSINFFYITFDLKFNLGSYIELFKSHLEIYFVFIQNIDRLIQICV
jgi:hypothetical protein